MAMTLRLHPHDPLVWRTPTSLRIGDGKHSTVFGEVTEEFERLLDGLQSGVSGMTLLEHATAVGLSGQAAIDICAALEPHLLESEPGFRPMFPDHTRRGRAKTNMSLDRRAEATVCIDGLNDTGVLTAWLLAERGIGTIVCLGDAEVGTGFADSLLTSSRFVGADKAEALAETLHAKFGTNCLFEPPKHVGLAVIMADTALLPKRYQYWLRRDTPHLAAVMGMNFALLSQTVIPGHGSCLECMALHQTDSDQFWPVEQAQLVNANYRTQDSLRVCALSAMVAEQSLLAIDHPVRLPDNQVRWMDGLHWRSDSVPPHDSCGCMGISAARTASGHDPGATAL